MPEHLSDLLHRSVDDLAVPAPDSDRIRGRGRSIRTRRRVGTALAAAAAVAVVAAGSALVVGGDDPRGSDITGPPRDDVVAPVSAADLASYDAWGAWAVGDQLTIGDHTVTVPDGVAALTQTSVGVVVRQESATDPFVLVRPDGSLWDLSIPGDVDRIVGDLDQPRVAWVEHTDDDERVRIWDVASDRPLADRDIPVTGTDEIPVLTFEIAALGDPWVHLTNDGDFGVGENWRTNGSVAVDYLPNTDVDSRATGRIGQRWYVYDPATGDELARFDPRYTWASLSPDGSHLFLLDGGTGVGEVRSGAEDVGVPVPGMSASSVWTPGGNLIGGGDQVVVRCEPGGDCVDRAVPAWTDGVELVVPDQPAP